jgi:tRNA/tmRNA/rRNA uracil-C5-methylase (TrmA/RlmC/RlmD family)
LIGRDYEQQLRIKREVVGEALVAWPTLQAVRVESCLPASQRTSYRNRAWLAVVTEGRGVVAGIRRPETNEIVDVTPCCVHGVLSLDVLPRVREWLAQNRLARPRGPVKFLDLREAVDERCHLTLAVEQSVERPLELPIRQLIEKVPELCGVAVNFSPAPSSYAFGPTTRTVWGSRSFLVPVGDRDSAPLLFEVPATAPFQIATGSLPTLHAIMGRHLGTDGALYDLYCGVGLHGLMVSLLAPESGRELLIGIEESVSATACARRNAERLDVRARFQAGSIERLLPELAARNPPARVILDPGRVGLRPGLVEALDPRVVRRAAYLSGNPVTLARDLARIASRGFEVDEVVPADLLPQTEHVSALALFHGAR